jgi:hypothetical protein
MSNLAYNTFIFSEQFDVPFINDLYAGDYTMIAETFTDVLNEYEALVQNIDSCWLAEDIPALKSAVHKIKPLFGFAGLTSIQSQCLHFENTCLTNPSVYSLVNEFTLLRNSLIKGKSIIEAEKTRLALFNSQ